jgi:hypothetical protein
MKIYTGRRVKHCRQEKTIIDLLRTWAVVFKTLFVFENFLGAAAEEGQG